MEAQTPRQDQVATIKKRDPGKRQVDIAKELGITRQRVHQIVKDLGYPPVEYYHYAKHCTNCGKELDKETKGNLCWDCYLADLHTKSLVELTCPQCGGVFTRRKGYINCQRKRGYRQFFCNGRCRSKVMSATLGTECGTCGRRFRTKGITFLEVNFGICEKCLEEIENNESKMQ